MFHTVSVLLVHRGGRNKDESLVVDFGHKAITWCATCIDTIAVLNQTRRTPMNVACQVDVDAFD